MRALEHGQLREQQILNLRRKGFLRNRQRAYLFEVVTHDFEEHRQLFNDLIPEHIDLLQPEPRHEGPFQRGRRQHIILIRIQFIQTRGQGHHHRINSRKMLPIVLVIRDNL